MAHLERGSAVGAVRRQQHVGHVPQRAALRQRLRLEHVQRRAPQLALLQRCSPQDTLKTSAATASHYGLVHYRLPARASTLICSTACGLVIVMIIADAPRKHFRDQYDISEDQYGDTKT